ncbi:uncharacterized protein K489DRAFT_48539 [Dissoconium aciculare CBS 342.82]|uniref:Peptidase A1 domain-containing protein n=1 Tax=Dissoconium aciculare CBS 342.82 TaxID=1314786 RepID=A0A6J3LX01_9PEZI|nr:uncharacterized protein K489DRAFT_48539 [Dissoconium aciculare CBS 342.82]KAF1820183.1 hypothetical protein K489DRAFT_48539 [Dissoconium aciculare CBS 342.82]
MPNAISIAPSQEFEGNDGNWSTFSIVVGTGPKQQRILPATSSEYVALVSPLGCVNTFNAGPSTACEFSRGGTPSLFNTSNSLTWTKLTAADGSKNFYLPFDSEQKLGNAGPGQVPASVGLDTVAFDLLPSSRTPNLTSQVVAVYNAVNPWIGMLGVRGIPNHLPLADSTSQTSVLQALKAAGTVPSVYFGYTAGKYYKSPQVFGSLTLGGYDGSRVDMSTALSVPISGSTTSDLSVYIKSITLSASGNRNNIPVGQFALIDSVVPEIWLPDTICDQVELALGLVYDKATQLYLVNDTLRTNLQNAAPSFTFNLAASGNSSNSIPITLPYGAFDQTARFPFAGVNPSNPTRQQRYFPLRRSNTTTGFFLGRTFLQEA